MKRIKCVECHQLFQPQKILKNSCGHNFCSQCIQGQTKCIKKLCKAPLDTIIPKNQLPQQEDDDILDQEFEEIKQKVERQIFQQQEQQEVTNQQQKYQKLKVKRTYQSFFNKFNKQQCCVCRKKQQNFIYSQSCNHCYCQNCSKIYQNKKCLQCQQIIILPKQQKTQELKQIQNQIIEYHLQQKVHQVVENQFSDEKQQKYQHQNINPEIQDKMDIENGKSLGLCSPNQQNITYRSDKNVKFSSFDQNPIQKRSQVKSILKNKDKKKYINGCVICRKLYDTYTCQLKCGHFICKNCYPNRQSFQNCEFCKK